MLSKGGKNLLYFCRYCEKDITLSLRIRCAECSPVVDLCGDCFAAGVCIDDHKNDHDYHVVDCLEASIFTKDWTTAEELMLLEGIEKFGAGNWKSVSEHIGNKTARQCDEHYWETYMGVFGHCLPSKTLVADNVSEDTDVLLTQTSESLDRIRIPNGHTLGEIVVRKDASGRSKDKSDLKEKLSNLVGADLPGYMPLRQDFDVEHDNEAEIILADMDMGLDDLPDHPSEKQLKLEVVRIYNSRLDERERRKKFVIEQGLIDFKKQQQTERRRTKDERDLVARLKVYSRFQSSKEQESLVTGVLRARRLKRQLQSYIDCRRMGLRTVESMRQHEVERKRRETESKAKKQREKESGILSTSMTTSSITSGKPRGRPRRNDDIGDDSQTQDEGKIGTAMKTAPGADLLTEAELNICIEADLLPMHYLVAKEASIREAYRNGGISQSSLNRVLEVSATSVIKPAVVDFFVRHLDFTQPAVASYVTQRLGKIIDRRDVTDGMEET